MNSGDFLLDDYPDKVLGIGDAITLSGDIEADMALFREFAAEIFAPRHLQARPVSRDATSVWSDPNIQYLTGLIDAGKAFVDYLGVVVDLQLLRHELSFLIVIADDEFCRKPFLASWEAKNVVGIAPRGLRAVLASGTLHASSAGLLQLAIESERLRELGVSDELV